MRALAALLLASLIVAPAQSAPSADAAYTAFAQRYFDWSFRIDPAGATEAGVHRYDTLVADLSARGYARRNADETRFLHELLAIEAQPLSPRTRVDAKAVELQIRDDLLYNETMQLWRRQPVPYVDDVSFALNGLIARRFASDETRMRAVIARENAVPAVFAAAKKNLTHVDATGAEIARGEAAGLASFLSRSIPQAFAGVRDGRLRRQLARSTARARSAVLDFTAWLEPLTAHPTGTYAVGADSYAAMLRYEDAVDMPLPQYLGVGERELQRVHAAMFATARRIDPKKSVSDVIADVERRHPSAAQVLAVSQADLVRLRRFIVARHIIDLPAQANISVVETPVFWRETTVAAMSAPGPLEQVATHAYYYVTPPDPRDSPRVQEAYLEQFSDYERPITGAHEVYPGHYTNYVIDRTLPLTLTEKLVSSSVFTEGWAHYCEQMIVDEGWGNGDPRVRLMQLRGAALRAARYVVGVKLHTAGMTVPEAAQFFQRQAFANPAEARMEAKRGTQDPLYGYYTLGKLEILKLRSDYKKKMGASYTLAGFHAALLRYGDFPVPLIRPLILGTADDGKVL